MKEQTKKPSSVQVILIIIALMLFIIGLTTFGWILAGGALALYFGEKDIAKWISGATDKVKSIFSSGSDLDK